MRKIKAVVVVLVVVVTVSRKRQLRVSRVVVAPVVAVTSFIITSII